MLANQNTWQDIKKYFSGTYIRCPEVDPKQVYHVDEVGPYGIKLRDIDGQLGLISFENGAEYQIKSPLVLQKEWVQEETQAKLVYRVPARMWKKGIHPENTQVSCLRSDAMLSSTDMSWRLLNRLGQGQVETKETLDNLIKEKTSLALNSRWALSSAEGYLYLHDALVGKVSNKRKHLSLLTELAKVTLPTQLEGYKVHHV